MYRIIEYQRTSKSDKWLKIRVYEYKTESQFLELMVARKEKCILDNVHGVQFRLHAQEHKADNRWHTIEDFVKN